MTIERYVTPSQTVGPFFHIGLSAKHSRPVIAGEGVRGAKIRLICRLFDAEDQVVNDGLIELWQANSDGKYASPEDIQEKQVEPGFSGFGRMATGEDGACEFHTIKPGRVPGLEGALQAPHIDVSVFARGMLRQLVTRIYFSGDLANSEDPVLALVPAERRETLMARPAADDPALWQFDIHLCGPRETVFFDA